jgi:hypothetical protein
MDDYYQSAYYSYYFRKSREGQDRLDVLNKDNREHLRSFITDFLISNEGQKMVRQKLDELRGNLIDANAALNLLRKDWIDAPDAHDFLYKLYEKMTKDEVKKSYNSLRRFKNYIREDGMEEIKTEESFDVETIKQIPIETIMDRAPSKRYADKDIYFCPIHNEKTPSFTVYKDKNRCHCFGCNFDQDVIGLYMSLYDTDFIGACKALLH